MNTAPAIAQPNVTLYQFELCPFCHKVRAALELKGAAYRKVEVAPGNKKELPDLPPEAPRKVPVLEVTTQGSSAQDSNAQESEIVWDSTSILLAVDQLVPDGPSLNSEDEEVARAVGEFEDWVDRQLMPALPTVIYDTWGNSIRAARITARESNFSAWDAFKVKVGGSIIMKLIVKRILKREGREDGHAWLQECLDYAEREVGEGPFVVGTQPTIADASLHGAFKCVEEFPIFETIMARPTLKAWYERIQELRDRA